MDDISKLSNAELSKQLKSHDLPSGPITKTTRPLFERKLRKHLAGSDSSGINESKDGAPKDESQHVGDSNHATASDIKPSVVDTPVEIGKEESDTTGTPKQFYSIQLPKDMQGRMCLPFIQMSLFAIVIKFCFHVSNITHKLDPVNSYVVFNN